MPRNKSTIKMSEYPHLRRQYREYRRDQVQQGNPNPKKWPEWVKGKDVKTVQEKRQKRNNNNSK